MMRYIQSILICLAAWTGINAQGIEFFHGTWEEALLKARQEDRIIFVDAYTTWCGPCRTMSAKTFPDPEVGTFFNTHFISMKIDMEKEMGLAFRQKFPVSAYPTLFFIDGEEKVVQKVVGAKNPADLIKLGESIVANYDKSHKYALAYEAGDRSYDLVYSYVAALNKSGKPTNKIANEYIATQTDLTTPENLRFLLEAATQVDCQCFEHFEANKARIIELTSVDRVDEQIRTAAANTVKRAIEFESPELIDQAGNVMEKHLPKEADFFLSQSRIQYALMLHALDEIEQMVTQHVKKFVKNDPVLLHRMALDLEKFAGDHPGAMQLAVDLSGRAAKAEETAYVMTYARLTHKVAGKDPAVRILDEALKGIADPESKEFKDLTGLRTKIQQS